MLNTNFNNKPSKGTHESHLEGVLQLELRVGFIGAEESQDVVALQHAERLEKLLAGDVGSPLRAAVPVEVLHELLQEGSPAVSGLVGQQHRLGELCDLLDALLGGTQLLKDRDQLRCSERLIRDHIDRIFRQRNRVLAVIEVLADPLVQGIGLKDIASPWLQGIDKDGVLNRTKGDRIHHIRGFLVHFPNSIRI